MRSFIMIQIALIILASCASKKEKVDISEEMSKTPSIRNESELYYIQKDMLLTNKNLTKDQKDKLSDLIQKSKLQNQEIQYEIAKTKAMLFKELMSDKENRYKIKVLEGQLLKLSRKKTRYSISTYKEARNIVGKSGVSIDKDLQINDTQTLRDL